MEKHLLKLIKLADELNEKQDKVFAEIHYCGDDSKKLEICIRMKKEYKYVEKIELQLRQSSIINWENAVHLFENYVNGGACNNE
jgi:hypothetical protein